MILVVLLVLFYGIAAAHAQDDGAAPDSTPVMLAPATLCTANFRSCTSFQVAVADFGNMPYGRAVWSTNLRVWMPGQDAQYPRNCGAGENSPCQYACNAAAFNRTGAHVHLPAYTALAVMRSPRTDTPGFEHADGVQCRFVDKVGSAARSGASIVFVFDRYSNEYTTMDTGVSNEELRVDASAPPSFLVPKDTTERVLKWIQHQRQGRESRQLSVFVNLAKVLPEKSKVAVDLWTTSTWSCHDEETDAEDCRRHSVLWQFSDFTTAMKQWLVTNRTTFNVRIPYLDQCRGWRSAPAWCSMPELAAANCIHQGLYCHKDPDGDTRSGGTGSDSLKQALRSRCAQKVSGNHTRPDLHLKYLEAWPQQCLAREDFSDDCAKTAFKKSVLGFLPSKKHMEIMQSFEQCVDEQMAHLDDRVENALLEEDIQLDQAITIDPTLIVNGAQVRGVYSSKTFLNAVCAAFVDDDMPEECYDLPAFVRYEQGAAPGAEGGGSGGGIGAAVAIVVSVLVAIVAAGVLFVMYTHVRAMRDEMRRFRSDMNGDYERLAGENETLREENKQLRGSGSASGADDASGSMRDTAEASTQQSRVARTASTRADAGAKPAPTGRANVGSIPGEDAIEMSTVDPLGDEQ